VTFLRSVHSMQRIYDAHMRAGAVLDTWRPREILFKIKEILLSVNLSLFPNTVVTKLFL